MLFVAPRNVAGSRDSTPSGRQATGAMTTTSGIKVTPQTAKNFAAVFAATRVISETLACMPCSVVRKKNARTTELATDHPLYNLLHTAPNPEQDKVLWFDMQTAFLLDWGNCYAEVQRDTLGQIVALWPIHPTRIPKKNIVRSPTNPTTFDRIIAGKPGELVYYINNDDQTTTAVPASDMLHVRGVMSQDGITGESIPKWGANSIGAALGAETHAASLFKNGAVFNVALKHPKALTQEAQDRLRRSWQTTYSGVANNYKTLVLEEGMEIQVLNMDPEATQLLQSRQFSINEIARWYRLPPHLLGDLTHATNSNIESEGISFATYSMLPWVTRWEFAIGTQLLTADEQKTLAVKLNMNGLLRADSAARGDLYQKLFNLGALSPNDIREREDLNPIKGGDQYFVQGNNCVPLDKIGELTQANIDKARAKPEPAPKPTPATDSAELGSVKNDLLTAVKTLGDSLAEQFRNSVATLLSKFSESQTATSDIVSASADSVVTKISEIKSAVESRLNALSQTLPGMAAEQVNAHLGDSAAVSRDHTLRALRSTLQAELSQLLAFEIRALKGAAKKSDQFWNWKDKFYPDFKQKVEHALSVFTLAAHELGHTLDCYGIADQYVTHSLSQLDKAESLPTSEFENGIAQLVETWADRPLAIANTLIPETKS